MLEYFGNLIGPLDVSISRGAWCGLAVCVGTGREQQSG
jgi:hypothetical protein